MVTDSGTELFSDVLEAVRYRYHKICKAFSKILLLTLRVDLLNTLFCLKALLRQGLSEPVSYGDLVYKFKGIV